MPRGATLLSQALRLLISGGARRRGRSRGCGRGSGAPPGWRTPFYNALSIHQPDLFPPRSGTGAPPHSERSVSAGRAEGVPVALYAVVARPAHARAAPALRIPF